MRVLLEKRIGQTPLEAIKEWQAAAPEYASLPACYAGRLDPMAEGKLLVLVGDECKKKDTYQGLDKEYVIEVVLDIGSDTGDVLGIVSGSEAITDPSDALLRATLRREHGKQRVPYPLFSSKTVNGKPLFLHTLEGSAVEVPAHEEQIYGIKLLSRDRISYKELERRITHLLSHAPTTDEPSKALGADFRINDVRKSWESLFPHVRSYTVLTLRVTCASGTYMRSLAGRIGANLGTKALALSIKRTRIGKYFPLPGLWREVNTSDR